ncbi:MAG: AAA family ATPase [Chloroflexota bacterium]|nr:AAA family ATPase [Chloroflexota bacterium]
MRRGDGAIIGRKAELAALESELAAAVHGLTAVVLEGEPGIGKTRLLVAASDLASRSGFTPVAVAADEELRGPFLLMRSFFSSSRVAEAAAGTAAEELVKRAKEALSGRPDIALDSMPADQRLLRQFDIAAVTIRELAAIKPLALLIDDVQWADEDSLRALRYVARTVASSPVFLLLAMRPEESATVNEAVTLVADLERMGLVRRLRAVRLTSVETQAFLRQQLGGELDAASASALHNQSEGVPFILEELTQAYRDAAMIQQLDGKWTIAKNAERLAPSSVRTLIQRRAGRLPADTKAVLAQAAVLGRSFSLKDLQALRERSGDSGADANDLAVILAPAVQAGLLSEHPDAAPADYSFRHEQVRQFSLSSLPAPRRRAIHAAIVAMLTEGDPTRESLPLLARHAAEAGDGERSARYAVEAARAALASNAPEEVLRAVDLALTLASAPHDRITLLSLRDDAMDMLRRPQDRLENLAELAALADALGDDRLEMQVWLRRAAALRQSDEYDGAAELARRAAECAHDIGDAATELAASLSLGQALLQSELGEGFVPSAAEINLDAAEIPFQRAAVLAEELGDDAALAAASRELGCIETGKVRGWFVERSISGEALPILARAAAGESLSNILSTEPVMDHYGAASRYFDRAIELFEKIGDRRGAMSSVIAMGYLTYGADVHAGPNAARRLEEIRRLVQRMRSMAKDSEREAADAQMAYGVHVFARAKVIPDLAISRGQEAYRAGQAMGDRAMEFLAAGGTAMALLDVGDISEAESWLGRAAQAAAAAPTPLRAWRLDFWRALVESARGDAVRMQEHFERALQTATAQGRASARCELLARFALEASRLGSLSRDEVLLELAERTAHEAKELASLFRGHQPWAAQADAATAEIALARDDTPGVEAAGREAYRAMQVAMREDIYPELLLSTARAVLAAGDESEKQSMLFRLQLGLAMTLLRTTDEDVRVRWLQGPVGKEWARLAGSPPVAAPPGERSPVSVLVEDERRLLALLTEGLTAAEIAGRIDSTEESVRLRLGEMFAKIGASSRGEATAYALAEGVL